MIFDSQTEFHLREALDRARARGEHFLVYLIEMALIEELRLVARAMGANAGRTRRH